MDDYRYWVDGQEFQSEVKTQIYEGKTVVALRPLVEAMGYDVARNQSKQQIKINHPDKDIYIELYLNNPMMFIKASGAWLAEE